MNANLFSNKIKNNIHKCPITATTSRMEIVVGNAGNAEETVIGEPGIKNNLLGRLGSEVLNASCRRFKFFN
jgi:hypothetical protein